MNRVIIYSTPSCSYCASAKEFFKKNNIAFEDLDIASNAKAREEMIQKSGQMGVPVIDIDGQIIVGFQEETLKTLLGIE
jgi:glutaredoxin-like YruB-family protein